MTASRTNDLKFLTHKDSQMATRRLAEPEELQRKVGSGRSDLDLGSSNLVDTLVDTVMCVIAVGFVLGLCHVLNMGIEQTVSYYSQVIGR